MQPEYQADGRQEALPYRPRAGPAPEGVPPPPGRRHPVLSFLGELPVLVLVALGVAILIKSFLVQPFYIPSGSMTPTIQVDDRVMVNKLTYRFGEAQRGDIIVFHDPYNFGSDEDEGIAEAAIRHVLEAVGIRTAGTDDFIKRVVAIGGDTVEIVEGRLMINGEPVQEAYLPPGTTMPDFGPEVIPPGHVFVMGDNRGGSQDSRVFGPIPVEEVVGKAAILIWPPDRWGGL